MKLFAYVLPIASAAGFDVVAAQKFRQPGWEFLYTVKVLLDTPWQIGDYGFGSRVVIPIIGGTFEGPRMKGTVTNLGADWGVVDTKGVFFPDTRYNLRTDDGADIFIQTAGPTQPEGKTLLRGTFQTGHPDYEWLNYVIATGILSRPDGNDAGNYVTIDMWQVSTWIFGADVSQLLGMHPV